MTRTAYDPNGVTNAMLDSLWASDWWTRLAFLRDARPILLDVEPDPRVATARDAAQVAFQSSGRNYRPVSGEVAEAVQRPPLTLACDPRGRGSTPVASKDITGVRTAALVSLQIAQIADLLSVEDLDLLTGPWRSAFRDPFAALRQRLRLDAEWNDRGQDELLRRITKGFVSNVPKDRLIKAMKTQNGRDGVVVRIGRDPADEFPKAFVCIGCSQVAGIQDEPLPRGTVHQCGACGGIFDAAFDGSGRRA